MPIPENSYEPLSFLVFSLHLEPWNSTLQSWQVITCAGFRTVYGLLLRPYIIIVCSSSYNVDPVEKYVVGAYVLCF